MDEYIYIIGGIAYVAYSIYSAMKKKEANAAKAAKKEHAYDESPVDTEEPKEFDFENLFGITEEKTEDSIPYELENNYDFEEVVEEKHELIDEIEPIQKKYDEKVFQQTENALVEEESEEERERLDLKKAIIYSEILNPPYIQK